MCCVKAFVTNGDPAAGLCGFIIFFGQVRNELGRAAPAQTIVCFCLFLIHHIKETKSSRMCEKIFCHAHQKSAVTRLSVFFEISTIDIVRGMKQTGICQSVAEAIITVKRSRVLSYTVKHSAPHHS